MDLRFKVAGPPLWICRFYTQSKISGEELRLYRTHAGFSPCHRSLNNTAWSVFLEHLHWIVSKVAWGNLKAHRKTYVGHMYLQGILFQAQGYLSIKHGGWGDFWGHLGMGIRGRVLQSC